MRFDSRNAAAFNNLGFIYKKLDRLDEAIKAYELAIAADTLFAQAYNNLGQLLKMRRADERAVGFFRQAIAIKPDLAEAYVNLAGVYKDQLTDEEAAVWRMFLEQFGDGQQYSQHARERLQILATP